MSTLHIEHYIHSLSQFANSFYNQNIIVTGAGSGYGMALSVALLHYGANVILLGREENKLLNTIEIAQSFELGKSIKPYVALCDITNMQNIEESIEKIKVKFGSIDILINCAAIPAANDASLSTVSEERWDDMMSVNVRAQWLISKEVLKLMNNKIARVLFFTSGAGWADTDGYGLYNISKAALNSLTVSMAQEYQNKYALKKISINGINPGEAHSEMNSGSQISPFIVCNMVFKILSTKKNIPNGKFFHRDGRYIRFCDIKEYAYELE